MAVSKPAQAQLFGLNTSLDQSEQGELMRQLRDAYNSGRYPEFTRAAERLPRNHLFSAYADIWQFRFLEKGRELNGDASWRSEDVQKLLEKHGASWPGEVLRRDWLQHLARTGQWVAYSEQRPLLRYRADQCVDCADILFATEQGQLPKAKFEIIIGSDKRLPRTCRFMLKSLFERDLIQGKDLDRHVFSLAAGRQYAAVEQFIDELGNTSWADKIDQQAMGLALNNPEKWLKNERFGQGSDVPLALALVRLANDNPEEAAEQLTTSLITKRLSDGSEAWLWGHLGHRHALLWNPKASAYFRKSKIELLRPEQQEWRVRAALLQEDWPQVLASTQELNPELRDTPTWAYWRGRALATMGRTVEARQEWLKISSPFSFYGKLASEELGATVSAPTKPEPLNNAELNKARRHPGLLRALALYDAGLSAEGRLEFNFHTAQMSDRELLATAAWAEKNQLFDRAIFAADRTISEHDLALRYLTPFRDNLIGKAQAAGLDPAWVYGLIRQESRFSTVARSHVGASGLMQVMPATAQYVAKKIGMDNPKNLNLNEINTNLSLGTQYLKMVYEQHEQSPVLACAGYNAGPSRPTLWKRRLGQRQVEGALFAELIPFDETRDYVKNVMSNTVAYALLLNTSQASLKQRLGNIRGSN